MGLDVLLDNTDRSSKAHWNVWQINLANNPINCIKCYKVKITPFMSLVLHSPNLSQFCSKASCFHAHCKHRMTPKMTLNTKRSQVHHLHVTTTTESFTLFRSMASHFRVTGHIKTRASRDIKMTLNPKRSKVPHLHVTTTNKSQISL